MAKASRAKGAPRKAARSASKAPRRGRKPVKLDPRKTRARSKSRSKQPRRSPRAVGRQRRPRRRLWPLGLLLLALLAVAGTVLVGILWERVSHRMEGRMHDQPARITGVVPKLAVGATARADRWRALLVDEGYREVARSATPEPGEFSLGPRRWVIHPRGSEAVRVLLAGNQVESLRRVPGGQVVPALELPQGAVALLTSSSRERRSVVPLSDMPLALQRAVVAIEDHRFYHHLGVDPLGILRAVVTNIGAGGVAEGGSTITQQLAKNMFLSADRTYWRKFNELILAEILEARYGKDELLEAYLNEIYLGQRGGYAIMGMAEAARVWFGKDVSALTVSQSATLAGAIRSPNRTTVWGHPQAARDRRDVVLRRMQDLHALPAEDLDAAFVEPLVAASGDELHRHAPWFIDAVVGQLSDRFAPEALHRDGLELVTTLDPGLQSRAERAVRDGLAELKRGHRELASGGGPQAVLLAMEPATGAVRALVGGADYGTSQFNRALDARRQPGSAIKPIVVAAALEARWGRLRPSTLLDDTPLTVPGAGARGQDWTPRDYDGRYLGPITLRRALEQSRNVPFVRLAMDIGLERVIRTAHTMGIASPMQAVPSLAIGSQDLGPLELATAYATLANGGLRPRPRLLEGVRDHDGDWLVREMPAAEPVLDPRVAAVVTNMLEGVADRGTARALRRGGFDLPVAVKTGTSNGGRDAWTVGYTPELVVVVWVGFDQDRRLGLSSTQAALPLWSGFIESARPWLSGAAFTQPAGLGPLLREVGDRPRSGDLKSEDRERRADEAKALRDFIE